MTTIRKAKQNDVKRITDLWCEFMDFHEQYDSIYKRAKHGQIEFMKFLKERISDRNSLVLIAKEGKNTCGYLLAKIESKPSVFSERRHGVIFDLAIEQYSRRKGLGEKLYQESIRWFKSKKINRIELSVATTNPISTKFWTKIGFQPYSERRYIKIDSNS